MNTLTTKSAKATKVVANAVQCGDTESMNVTNKNFKWVTPEEFMKKYHWYVFNRGNGTDPERVSQIAQSIAFNGTDWMLMPVLVNAKTHTVLDGNTSGAAQIEAYQKYGWQGKIMVLEVDVPSNVTDHIGVQKLNNERDGWQLEDYILTAINEGKVDYIRLKEMVESLGMFFYDKEKDKHQWRYTSSLAGSNQAIKIKEGKYVLTKKDVEEQTTTGKEVIEMWNIAGQPKIAAWVEAFIFAWIKTKAYFGKNLNYTKIKKYLATEEGKRLFDGNQSTKVWVDRFNQILVG